MSHFHKCERTQTPVVERRRFERLIERKLEHLVKEDGLAGTTCRAGDGEPG
jgi:hypothetical protein